VPDTSFPHFHAALAKVSKETEAKSTHTVELTDQEIDFIRYATWNWVLDAAGNYNYRNKVRNDIIDKVGNAGYDLTREYNDFSDEDE
jgi:hypothetical protein